MSSEQVDKVQDIQPEVDIDKCEHEDKPINELKDKEANLIEDVTDSLMTEALFACESAIREEENEQPDKEDVLNNQTEATQTDIDAVEDLEEKIDTLEKVLSESINAYEDYDDKPGDYLILSIINMVLMLCMRSFGFFVAVPAFYFSLRTIEAAEKGDLIRALRNGSDALNLNCFAILVTMSEFFVYPHLGLLFDLWIWEMLWFF